MGISFERASLMTSMAIFCVVGSRPRPGPMTMTCRRDRKATMGSASARASEGGTGLLEAEDSVPDDWRIGCTIRFGE